MNNGHLLMSTKYLSIKIPILSRIPCSNGDSQR